MDKKAEKGTEAAKKGDKEKPQAMEKKAEKGKNAAKEAAKGKHQDKKAEVKKARVKKAEKGKKQAKKAEKRKNLMKAMKKRGEFLDDLGSMRSWAWESRLSPTTRSTAAIAPNTVRISALYNAPRAATRIEQRCYRAAQHVSVWADMGDSLSYTSPRPRN